MARWHTLANQVSQLYRKVLPIPCLLCGLPSLHSALCDACRGDLPLLDGVCTRCALPINSAQICGHCLQSPPIQQHTISLYRYESAVRQCITAFKYYQRIYLAEMFATEFVTHVRLETLPDCIVPIPLHARRLWRRGYNQSALVAKAIAKRWNIPYRPELLQRIRHTSPQENLTAQQRRSNLRHAFICPNHALPEHVAVFDDVMTSGATTSEACRVLAKQGAVNIEVWTIARTIGNF